MASRKRTSKTPRAARGVNTRRSRLKVIKAYGPPPAPLPFPPELTAPGTYDPNLGVSLVWGVFDNEESEASRARRRRIPCLPNPWPPSDIVALLKIACSTAGLAGVAYKTIKLWFDSRNAKRIRIKKGEYELEIQGWMSKTEIERHITHFRALTRALDEDEIKVILPSSVDRTLPSGHAEKKGGKK